MTEFKKIELLDYKRAQTYEEQHKINELVDRVNVLTELIMTLYIDLSLVIQRSTVEKLDQLRE